MLKSDYNNNIFNNICNIIDLNRLDLEILFTKLKPIIEKIEIFNNNSEPIIIGIDGNCCGGKSTIAKIISQVYNCNIFKMDHFFLSLDKKTPQRLAEPGGNVDYERFESQVLKKIKTTDSFSYDVFNCQNQSYDNSIEIISKNINIVEGSYCMHPRLIKYYDYKIFVSVDKEIQKNRVLKRNGQAMYKRFIQEWIPLENYYFEKLKIVDQSDFIIDTTSK